jgi:hypothetical protein
MVMAPGVGLITIVPLTVAGGPVRLKAMALPVDTGITAGVAEGVAAGLFAAVLFWACEAAGGDVGEAACEVAPGETMRVVTEYGGSVTCSCPDVIESVPFETGAVKGSF